MLLLLLHALGEIKQQGSFAPIHRVPTLDDREGLPIGEQAPSFSAVDQDGKIIKLEDFQGQRRILAFIFPGCSACPGAIEVLNRVVQSASPIVPTITMPLAQLRVITLASESEYPAKEAGSFLNAAYPKRWHRQCQRDFFPKCVTFLL